MKTCSMCLLTLPDDRFTVVRDKRCRPGHSRLKSECKACASNRAKANQAANYDRAFARQKAWREANKAKWNLRMNVAGAKRRAVKLKAHASWADNDLIADLYEYAAIMRQHGVEAEVDHIVPLQGETVCGLHTHDNLTVILAEQNRSKRNNWSHA